MGVPIDPKKKAWVKVQVETTGRSFADIAREARISLGAVQRWAADLGWRRPDAALRPKLTPQRLEATRRGYELGMHGTDLAILNGRSASWLAQLARAKGWRRASAGPDAASAGAERAPLTARPEIAAIEEALLSDRLDRAELVLLIERATAIAAVDALTGRDRQAEARLAWLARAAAIVKSLPARDVRPAAEDRNDPDGIAPFSFIETDWLSSAERKDLRTFMQTLPRRQIEYMWCGWPFRGRRIQFPDEAGVTPWTIWLVLGGRGAGKTRAGAVMGLVGGVRRFGPPARRIALVGETFAAARDVMVEGDSGILKAHERSERPAWSPSLRKLEWPNGAVAHVFSSEDPDSLRGPQFEAAWCDELAKWRHVEETWDMLQFGLRLGPRPREIVTTTPRPIPLLRRLLADPRVVTSRAKTADNAANLSPGFLDSVVAHYAGTRRGRQELEGEIVEDRPDALWSRAAIEKLRAAKAPPLARIVVAVDPPASSGRDADACGIVAADVDAAGVGYVLEDATASGLSPERWAARALALYRRLEADALVVETNQGGEMVEAVMRQVDPGVPVTRAHAMRGKYLRAEPVSTLYEQARVHHAGAFPELEDEMCDFGPTGLSNGRSPDRLDALVWALHHLMLAQKEARVRVL